MKYDCTEDNNMDNGCRLELLDRTFIDNCTRDQFANTISFPRYTIQQFVTLQSISLTRAIELQLPVAILQENG